MDFETESLAFYPSSAVSQLSNFKSLLSDVTFAFGGGKIDTWPGVKWELVADTVSCLSNVYTLLSFQQNPSFVQGGKVPNFWAEQYETVSFSPENAEIQATSCGSV